MVQPTAGLKFIIIFFWGYQMLMAVDSSSLVDVKKYDFSLKLDIELAKKNTTTGERVYEESRCILRPDAAKALSRVQAHLKLQNYELLIKDCYRPISVQKRFAEKLKDSLHSNGGAVDVVLIDKMGALAGSENERILEKAMKAEFFFRSKKISQHYDFKPSVQFPELDVPMKDIP